MPDFLTFAQIDKIVDECAALNDGICSSEVCLSLKKESEESGKEFLLEKMVWREYELYVVCSAPNSKLRAVEVLFDYSQQINDMALSEFFLDRLKYSKIGICPVKGLDKALLESAYAGFVRPSAQPDMVYGNV